MISGDISGDVDQDMVETPVDTCGHVFCCVHACKHQLVSIEEGVVQKNTNRGTTLAANILQCVRRNRCMCVQAAFIQSLRRPRHDVRMHAVLCRQHVRGMPMHAVQPLK